MLEPLDGGLLWTWAFAAEPGAEQQATAERLANHRTAYLDFEGPISGGHLTQQLDQGDLTDTGAINGGAVAITARCIDPSVDAHSRSASG